MTAQGAGCHTPVAELPATGAEGMARRPTATDATDAITAEQVRALAVEVLAQRVPLGLLGDRYADADIYQVVVAAAAQARSVESVARQLVGRPSANRVRQVPAGHP